VKSQVSDKPKLFRLLARFVKTSNVSDRRFLVTLLRWKT